MPAEATAHDLTLPDLDDPGIRDGRLVECRVREPGTPDEETIRRRAEAIREGTCCRPGWDAERFYLGRPAREPSSSLLPPPPSAREPGKVFRRCGRWEAYTRTRPGPVTFVGTFADEDAAWEAIRRARKQGAA